MATAKEQLEALKKKKEKLIAREKQLQAKVNAQERKARTKRLIETGALVESKCGELDLVAFAKYLDNYKGYIIKNCSKNHEERD